MKNTTYVPLKNDLLMRLIERYKENYPVAIDDVIEDFLERTAGEHEAQAGFREGGYAWDQVELPAGTQLRTRYFNQWQVATLKNGKFYFGNKAYQSPAKVCNAMRGNKTTNAWMMLQIKRPQDIEFRNAEKFRG
ncbi:MAG: hypothetical protein OEU50_11710 [Gammaproteobacteria bacterium]|nr:hypothetical protein [Gammaproteobacteria bacterium]